MLLLDWVCLPLFTRMLYYRYIISRFRINIIPKEAKERIKYPIIQISSRTKMFNNTDKLRMEMMFNILYLCSHVRPGLYGNDDFHNGALQAFGSGRQIKALVLNFTNKVSLIYSLFSFIINDETDFPWNKYKNWFVSAVRGVSLYRLIDWNTIFERRCWCRIWRTFWIGQHSIKPHCEFYWTMYDRCVRIRHVRWAPSKPCCTSSGPPTKVTRWNKCLGWVISRIK